MKNLNYGQNDYREKLFERFKRDREMRDKILNLLSIEQDIAIVDIQQKLGMKRSTLKHWLDKLEKKGLIISKKLDNEQGRPTVYRANKRRLNDLDKLLAEKWKSHEEYEIKSISARRILHEIEVDQSYKQHEKLIKLFQEFKQDSYGAKLTFLLYSDCIKVDYKFSLTPKGKASRKARKRYKAKKKASS